MSKLPCAPCALRETTLTGVGAVEQLVAQVRLTREIVSIREPGLAEGVPLLSEPCRHCNLMFWPDAAAGRLTTEVM